MKSDTKILGQYINGNNSVTIYEDGTKVRKCIDVVSVFDFPECIDLTISTRCHNFCRYCYLGCTPRGIDADLTKFDALFDSIHPYTEIAINYNHNFKDEQLTAFLSRCTQRQLICNLTVNQNTFISNFNQIKLWNDARLVRAVGISVTDPNEQLLSFADKIDNTVFHTIVGVTDPADYYRLFDRNLKLLILGFKSIQRGQQYQQTSRTFEYNKQWLYRNVDQFAAHFDVVGFDNLAVEQLNGRRLTNAFDSLYLGDDGSHTMYIDLVHERYYRSSSSTDEIGRPLTNNVNEMFRDLQVR